MKTENRIIFLDYLRVIACFLVLLTHANEPVYLGGQGTAVASSADAFWSTFFISFSRCAVALFVIASSYLQFPVKYSTGDFFRKRLTRVAIPALVWLTLYALFGGGEVSANFTQMAFNFPAPAGHLWFCYMIIGLYILMPLLSPWAERVEKKELLGWIALWGFTTLAPVFRQASMALCGSVDDLTGWGLWGEANWSEFGLLYYISGYVGYMLIGLYFRKFAGEMPWRKTLAIALPCFAVGFAIAAAWFYGFMPKTFPFDQPLKTAIMMETLERNCTPSVALMTLGAFLVIRKINYSGRLYRTFILPASSASYGIYLMHIFALVPLYAFWRDAFGSDCFWSTPCVVLTTAVSTFVICLVVSRTIQIIPKIGKYIVG